MYMKKGCNQCGKPLKDCGHKTLQELMTKEKLKEGKWWLKELKTRLWQYDNRIDGDPKRAKEYWIDEWTSFIQKIAKAEYDRGFNDGRGTEKWLKSKNPREDGSW